jgi:hypothetical protein
MRATLRFFPFLIAAASAALYSDARAGEVCYPSDDRTPTPFCDGPKPGCTCENRPGFQGVVTPDASPGGTKLELKGLTPDQVRKILKSLEVK